MMTDTDDSDSVKPLAYSYIRWSSDQQTAGDSLARQTKAAEDWAVANGYTLSTQTFRDSGVSAFKGRNAEVGALNSFLKVVEEGVVPQGSTLLVENLDRLSRQHWEEGYLLLRQIVRAGVNLVTLFDGKLYPANQPFDLGDGIMIIVGFQRAWEESVTKSKRIKAAWDTNTEEVLAGERLRTARCPQWLKIKGPLKGGTYQVIPERADVLREIFTRFAEGEGPSAIARDLNARGIPTFQRGNWRGPTVAKLLKRESPYGHIEIGRQITEDERSGKEPIPKGMYRLDDRIIERIHKDHFPRVIDEDLERRVRFRLSNREAEVRAMGPVKNTNRITKACLTGVLKGDLGENLKRKAYKRTAAYVSPVTNKYYGAVAHIDQVLIDWWPELRKASLIETDPQTEGLEQELSGAQETLEYLQSKPGVKPRLLMAAEAEVEELKNEIDRRIEAHGLASVDLPRDVSKLEPHEVNALVRRVVASAAVYKSEEIAYEMIEVERPNGTVYERRQPRPLYDLGMTLKNGLVVNLGTGSSGFTKVSGSV
jgi:DNA invertase Pin-like site-specific DNA recombinase